MLKPLSFLAACVASLQAQIFSGDHFSSGDFSANGVFTQSQPLGDVVGGYRTVETTATQSTVSVSNGKFSYHQDENGSVTLRYGWVNGSPGAGLNFDPADWALFVEVTTASPAPDMELLSHGLQPPFTLHMPSNYTGVDAGLHQFLFPSLGRIHGFALTFDNFVGDLVIESITIRPRIIVPEPQTYALLIGAGLLGFAGLRRIQNAAGE